LLFLLRHAICCFQGKEIIEHFVIELKKEGITYLPPWSEPCKAIPDDNGGGGGGDDDLR
jgi:hypothetical protein